MILKCVLVQRREKWHTSLSGHCVIILLAREDSYFFIRRFGRKGDNVDVEYGFQEGWDRRMRPIGREQEQKETGATPIKAFGV